ncbi:MAG TPA: tetratricopeptide repeat protein [Gaiellaceae bacterium]|nr:tetratricopeptide repeat protein [Gaiellaceae bacterium]
MSRNGARVLAGLAAAASAALVVGVTVLQADDGGGQEPAAEPRPERRPPPLELGLLLRDDEQARALREAERLLDEGDREGARARFEELAAADPESVEAAVGAAVAAWPEGTVERLDELVADHPASGVARLHLGFALLASGDAEGAEEEWRQVERRDPDTPAALRAEDVLHPSFAPGRPPFVAPLGAPAGVAGLPPAEQLAELERRAARGVLDAQLLYGIALQRSGQPVSASEAFARAAAAHPGSTAAKVASALGRFDKDDPSQAFSRLGPLARADETGVVRYHLGLALSWLGQVEEARRQLRLARAAAAGGFYGREAERLLDRLEGAGS